MPNIDADINVPKEGLDIHKPNISGWIDMHGPKIDVYAPKINAGLGIYGPKLPNVIWNKCTKNIRFNRYKRA